VDDASASRHRPRVALDALAHEQHHTGEVDVVGAGVDTGVLKYRYRDSKPASAE
jgi:hypothetical protein